MTLLVSLDLSFEVFAFVVGLKTESMQVAHSSFERERYLGAKLALGSRLRAYDRTDMRLVNNDDSIGHASFALKIKCEL